jgi:predicted KAP-like P-loop ATPase
MAADGKGENHLFLNDLETEVDLLYHEAIAKTVVTLVRKTRESSVTIGVHGDWGAGKSSVLKMTQAAFKEDERVLCLWFNGWTFEGFEDAKTVVIETIVDELRRARRTSAKVAEVAKRVLKRVDWLKLAKKAGGLAFTAFTGVPTLSQLTGFREIAAALLSKKPEDLSIADLKDVASKAGDYLKEPTNEAERLPEHIHAFREEFQELLSVADIDQLVVIVDDLDRCLPKTAIATLEAIRLFLLVPRTAFVIGADELMIEYAVREHFPDLPSTGPVPYARHYLEKLIQVPFRIPALGLAETRTYVTLLLAESALGSTDERFKKLLAAARDDLRRPWISRGLDRAAIENVLATTLPPEVNQAITISAQLSKVLTDGARGNPRQIKRFLNSMMLRSAIAEARGFAADIQRPVLAKVMLAERFAPEFYEQLARLTAAAPNGRPAALAALEDHVRLGEDTEKDGAPGRGAPKKEDPDRSREADEWLKIDWVKGWATIEPLLRDVDLRPYVFVTRDKRSYLGSLATSSHLEELMTKLMGPRLLVRNAASEVAKLSGSAPEEVFQLLRDRVLQADSLGTAPPGTDGLVLLVEKHPALQGRLLAFVRELPVSIIGAWAASSWSCLTDASVAGEFRALLQSWSQQTENNVLQKAAQGILRVKRN